MDNCDHEVVRKNPITDDPLNPIVKCVKCGKEERVGLTMWQTRTGSSTEE